MQVQTEQTINGKVVHQIGKVGPFKVFQEDIEDSCGSELLYFVNQSGNVVSTMGITADMSQGCGFISDIEINKV